MTDTQTHSHTPTHTDMQCLSPRQVGDLFGLPLTTVRRWVKSGVLPSFKLGRRVFIPRAALIELMQPRVPQPARRPVLSTREAWDADHPHA